MTSRSLSQFIITCTIILLPLLALGAITANPVNPAPNFTGSDTEGNTVTLSDYRGEVVILHFTGLETPLCLECEQEMKDQLKELESLESTANNISIITINIRKNAYSESGKDIAEDEYKIKISWPWLEDFSPYPIGTLYFDYWTVDGSFSNPTLVLIDHNQSIVGVYNVYCIGKGSIDGVQSAQSLADDAEKILSGEWNITDVETSESSVGFLGMFALGIITVLSPCSIALLISMISYVGATQGKQRGIKEESFLGFKIGIAFTLGMSIIFFLMGLLLSYIGFFIEISTVFYLIAGIILFILGVNIIKPLKDTLSGLKKSGKETGGIMEKGGKIYEKISKKSLILGGFFLGIFFAIGWAPCAVSLIFPVFILVLTQKTGLLMGGMLLFVFGIGHGIPIIPLTTLTRGLRAKIGNAYVAAGKIVEKVFAGVIIVIAVIFILRYFGFRLW